MKSEIISASIIKCFFITILLFCSNIYSQSAIELGAVVADRITRQPIAYANIGFIDRGVGTVSDEEGYFELSFLEKRITISDTIQLTMQGYYPLRIASANLRAVMEKTQVLFLSPLPNNIKTDNSIDRKNLVQHQIGATQISTVNTGWLPGVMKGAELASLVSISSPETYLDHLQFTVLEQKADSTKVRINIYDFSANNIPGNKVTQSIYHTITRKQGVEVINLMAKNINVNKDIVVGLELLESYGDDAGHLQIALSDEIGTSFLKATSQDSWQELPYNAIGFSLSVSQSSEVETTKEKITKGNWITGIVAASEQPIQGCEVSVKGKLRSVYTRANGSFSIEAGVGDVLLFRSLVNEPKDVLVENDASINVILKPKYDELGEVLIQAEKKGAQEEKVNTAVGEVKKEQLGYAVYTKSKDELGKSATTLGELIRGRFPSVLVYGPPRGEQYKMRGNNTFIGSGAPLFVVDGAPLQTTPNNIDINTITDISVIPGLAGATRFGTLGRNGVILIKTTNTQDRSGAEKEPKNNLLVKGNDYDGSAIPYNEDSEVKHSIFTSSNSSSLSEIKERYLTLKEDNRYDPNYYLEGFRFFIKKDKAFAFTILESAVEVANDNSKMLRSLAFIYEENDQFEKAYKIYQRIGELEPQRSQTYLDLAQNYVSRKEYEKAFSLFKLMIDNKIPGVVFGDDMIEIVITELKHLVTNHKNIVDYRDLHTSFYNKVLHLDGRIVFEWNDPQSEFELQFVGPDNKYFMWSHTPEAQPEEIKKELIQGYNIKQFILDEAEAGKWLVNIKSYNATERSSELPQFIKCVLYENYGMPNETKKVNIVALEKTIEKNTLIGQIMLE